MCGSFGPIWHRRLGAVSDAHDTQTDRHTHTHADVADINTLITRSEHTIPAPLSKSLTFRIRHFGGSHQAEEIRSGRPSGGVEY